MKEMISAVTHILLMPSHSRPFLRTLILSMTITAAAVLSASTSYAGQWQQDADRWWYENDDRTFPAGAWKWINGTYYYFDENGYMMSNTTTPDGYQVGADGAFVPGPGQSVDQVGGIRCGDEDAVIHMWMNNEGTPIYQNEIHYGLECYVIEPGVDSFLFPSGSSNLNPDAHEVWLYGVTMVNGEGVILEGINMMPFEYDKVYSFDFTGKYDTAGKLAQHCIDNDVTITVHLVDRTKYSILTGYPASAWRYRYATSSSIPAAL